MLSDISAKPILPAPPITPGPAVSAKPCLTPEQSHPFLAQSLLVIDLEATCFLPMDSQGRSEEAQKEVIQIGAVHMHRGKLLAAVMDQLVRPEKSYITHRCQKLTGISPQMVRHAPSFRTAMEELGHLVQRLEITAWAGWGDFDGQQIYRQCLREVLPHPMGALPYFNLSRLLSPALLGEFAGRSEYKDGKPLRTKDRVSVERACEMLGFAFPGQPHNALADAKATAMALERMAAHFSLNTAAVERTRRVPAIKTRPASEAVAQVSDLLGAAANSPEHDTAMKA